MLQNVSWLIMASKNTSGQMFSYKLAKVVLKTATHTSSCFVVHDILFRITFHFQKQFTSKIRHNKRFVSG